MSKFFVTALCVCAAVATLAAPVGSKPPAGPIVVTTTAELDAALVEANAGRTVLVRAGTYFVDHPLAVPDGMQLEGEGVMLGDPLPTGFKSGTATRIRAHPGFTGDFLTLGDRASLRRLIVEDSPNREGNAVAVRSRAPGDSVSASIVECEIVGPKGGLPGPDGPTGGGIVALTSNRDFENPPGPDVGAAVDVRVTRTIVRAAGRAFFAMNFATRGRVHLALSQNLVAGTLEAFGGISRPDEVVQAVTTIESNGNLYAPTAAPGIGWQLVGGSSGPRDLGNASTSSNTVRITSNGDRIEAKLGILAIAGRHQTTFAGVSSDNIADLILRGLAIRTSGHGAADLVLHAAEGAPVNDNVLRVDMRDSTGSGPRLNEYSDVQPAGSGVGNRLEFNGTPALFAASNTGIDPPPPSQFFDATSGP